MLFKPRLTGYTRTYCNALTLHPTPIHFLLYLARGVMNSSFWKMGNAKNRLLLLFVAGSSRASVRSTATDDREGLSSPLPLRLFVLLIHLGCSPCTSSCSTSFYTDIQPLTIWKSIHFLKLFVLCRHWCFCTALFRDQSNSPYRWHLHHRISMALKFLGVALYVCYFCFCSVKTV